jgi:hypothetical protein
VHAVWMLCPQQGDTMIEPRLKLSKHTGHSHPRLCAFRCVLHTSMPPARVVALKLQGPFAVICIQRGILETADRSSTAQRVKWRLLVECLSPALSRPMNKSFISSII